MRPLRTAWKGIKHAPLACMFPGTLPKKRYSKMSSPCEKRNTKDDSLRAQSGCASLGSKNFHTYTLILDLNLTTLQYKTGAIA